MRESSPVGMSQSADDRLTQSPLFNSFNRAASARLRFAEPRYNQTYLSNLRERLRQAQADTIIAFLSALQAKDAYTHQHSINVSTFAESLAHLLKLATKEIEKIHVAALLHDIGKIGIPDAILTKPGRLTPAEFDIMKQHSEIGASMLQPITSLNDEMILVRHHHEWFDGSGYPGRIKGDTIPFGSRIIQIADSIDAMLSPRCYKTGHSADHAISELKRGRARQFDPTITDAAVKILQAKPTLLALAK